MLQMSLNLFAPCKTQPANLSPKAVLKASTKLGFDRANLVDVTETAQEVGIACKVAMTGELYDRLQRRYQDDENEAVLWNVLWLAKFERSLEQLTPTFTFTVTTYRVNDQDETLRLRFVAGDPVIIEIA